MNDDTENFERRVKQTPLRPVPPDWRADILRVAQAEQAHAAPSQSSARSTAKALSSWFLVFSQPWSLFAWPRSRAWIGLAAVWVLIAAVKFSLRDTAPEASSLLAAKPAPPSPEMMAELRSQQRMFAELSGQSDSHEADRPKNISDKPHSERTEFRAI